MIKKTIIGIVVITLIIGGGAYAMNLRSQTTNNQTATEQPAQEAPEKNDPVNQEGDMEGTPDNDIVTNTSNSPDHTTFMATAQAANLVETLKGQGPYTVFAPTDTAFEKLPEGTVDTVLLPENNEQLTNLLTYHIVPGSYRASDFTDGMTLETQNGQTLTFTERNSTWYINDSAMITTSDVISSNGVIHVVDTVLLPN